MDIKILENEDDSTVNDDSTTYAQPIQPGEAPGRGVEVRVSKPYSSPMYLAKSVSDEYGVCVLDAVPGGVIFVYGVKGNTYYELADRFVQGGRIKATLRPNGKMPVVPIAASLTVSRTSVFEGDTITFYLTVQGLPLTPKSYTITGVNSNDIGGASLTGSITLTDQAALPGQYRTGSGTLVLTAGDIGGGNKTLTLTLDDMIGGQVLTSYVTIEDPNSDAAKGTLSIAIDSTGSGLYTPAENYAYAGPGYKIKISLATVNIPNSTIPYTIAGVTSNDISGAALSGGFVVSNGGNAGYNTSYSSLILTVDPALSSFKTLNFVVNYADASSDYLTIYLSSTPPS
jgi:hypothetical protein